MAFVFNNLLDSRVSLSIGHRIQSVTPEKNMNDPILDDKILTTQQAAKLANQQPMTMSKWRSRGKGPPYLRLGGKIRYRLSDIRKWIESSVINPSEQKAKRRRRK
jgi:predicted DNA-binding transcriptional regulator AlpA